MKDSSREVPASTYTENYFLSECEGHEEYLASAGKVVPDRVMAALAEAGDPHLAGGASRRVLDLGCGRGELVRFLLDHGFDALGIDYSADALALASRILRDDASRVVQADATQLPYGDNEFDLLFALDLVEHLHPEQLDRAMSEARRVLRPGGRLIVHTMPNIWYYRFGYPLFRIAQRLRGTRLPRNPRDRWQYVKHVHVNEQSVVRLGKTLRRAGFRARVRLRNTQTFEREASPAARRLYRLLSTVYPFAWIFCSDIFAVATKPLAPATMRYA